ncbi:glycosyltransferase family 2 protein [Neobacillus cucumis]|uniref:Glycosyltransferase 2-like domain-containing protein n=1 Tax=Neobacillus cucumis TaxID=1740721 RepID=A0A2N5H6F7_9BACI|nr:glycosyltransferase family 2 protein [Neobacillus cucumis]PLS01117.1 hypothetical protein CVD27_27435 [Neobacillus cucumis]
MTSLYSPLLSIVIPVYNAEKFLKRCIESVLNQSFKDFEVILVNDGSIDGSGGICDYYCEHDERVHVYHLKNGGPSWARNHGINHAKGTYITFMDADDFVDSSFSEAANRVRLQDYDFIVAPYCIVDTAEKPIQHYQYREKSFSNNESKGEFLRTIWLGEPLFGSCWNKWYKKSIIMKNNLKFNNDFYIAEDFLFNLHYYRECRSAILISSAYYYYVLHGNSVTSGIYYNRFEIAKTVYEESLRLLADLNINDVKSRSFLEESYLSGVLRAMFDLTKAENKLTFKDKMLELKKYVSDMEVRSILRNDQTYNFNRLAYFCLKYQSPLIYYTAFKIRYLMKG